MEITSAVSEPPYNFHNNSDKRKSRYTIMAVMIPSKTYDKEQYLDLRRHDIDTCADGPLSQPTTFVPNAQART